MALSRRPFRVCSCAIFTSARDSRGLLPADRARSSARSYATNAASCSPIALTEQISSDEVAGSPGTVHAGSFQRLELPNDGQRLLVLSRVGVERATDQQALDEVTQVPGIGLHTREHRNRRVRITPSHLLRACNVGRLARPGERRRQQEYSGEEKGEPTHDRIFGVVDDLPSISGVWRFWK
jgi:hypothetical protein